MTHADFNDLETRDYIFKIGDRGKGIRARYDENTDAIIFPRAAFDYVYELLKEALSQEPCDDAISRILKKMWNCRGKHTTSIDKVAMEQIIRDELSVTQKPIECDDAISRQAVLDGLKECMCGDWVKTLFATMVKQLPSVTQKSGKWIPVSERLPEDLEAVNITWVNHEPEPYYHDIKDRNFTATGIHYRGKWYWYSTTCADYLGEYGSNEVDEVDSAIEIVAWMPLPEPYEPQERSE